MSSTAFANGFVLMNKFPTAKGIDPNTGSEITYTKTPVFECDLNLDNYSKLIVFSSDHEMTPYLERRGAFFKKKYVVPTIGYYNRLSAYNSYYADGLDWAATLKGTFKIPDGELNIDLIKGSRASGDTTFHGNLGTSSFGSCVIHKPFDSSQVIIP